MDDCSPGEIQIYWSHHGSTEVKFDVVTLFQFLPVPEVFSVGAPRLLATLVGRDDTPTYSCDSLRQSSFAAGLSQHLKQALNIAGIVVQIRGYSDRISADAHKHVGLLQELR